jgi:hypothetical protein
VIAGRSTLKIIGYLVFFAIFSTATAQADEISIDVDEQSPFTDVYVNSNAAPYQIDVASNGGDPVVQFYSGVGPTEFNSINNVNPANHVAEDDDGGPGLDSRLTGTPAAGDYTIRVTSYLNWIDYPSETRTYTLTFTGLTYTGISRPRKGVGSSLRIETAGTITEKSNIVSCTPGSYTFLNSGSTSETANIQSFVYTLLLNGKAVSTLSTDGFRSVPAHLFPTIAGNMAGTATLTGATWDLSGMSNYAVSCQVFAWQNGANVQSTTATISDSVKTAAEAAKAQAWEDQRATATAANFTKDMREMRKRLAARQP